MGVLMVGGGVILFNGNMWGLVPFIIGGLMTLGFKGPKSTTASPVKKVWLLTFLGRQTTTIVRGLTLVMDWPFEIVGYIEIDLKKVDHDFKMSKPILCMVDMAYVNGIVSVSMVPDDKDDTVSSGRKSGGEKLQDFLNIGGIEGGKTQLDDILTASVQEVANECDTIWMETNVDELSKEILGKIKKGRLPSSNNEGDEGNDIDDTIGFGLKFPKFQVILKPVDKVIDARNDSLIESAQREAELADTETVNQRVEARLKLYYPKGIKGNRSQKVKQARDEVFEELSLKEGKYTRIANRGGVNVVNTGRSTT